MYLNENLLNNPQWTGARDEYRNKRLGLVDAINDSAGSNPDLTAERLQALSLSASSKIPDIPYFEDGEVIVRTEAGYDQIPDNVLDTNKYVIEKRTIFSGYSFSPTHFRGNAIAEAEYHTAAQRRVFQGMAEQFNSDIMTDLEAVKSQKMKYTAQLSQREGVTYTFDEAADELQVSSLGSTNLYRAVNQLNRDNLVGGNLRIVTSPAGLFHKEDLAMVNGLNQSVNYAVDQAYLGADKTYVDDTIAIQAGSNANGWVIGDGALEYVTIHPYEFQVPKKVGEREFGITPTNVPFLNRRLNVYTDVNAANVSAGVDGNENYDNVMSHTHRVGYWFPYWVIKEPNSTIATKATKVTKLNLLEA